MWVLSAASMTVGNLIALRQTNVVRMLAYSGVAQAGFMLAPLAVIGGTTARTPSAATVTYLVIYGAMNLGRLCGGDRRGPQDPSAEIDSFGGLFQYAPGLTVVMTIALTSLAGIPPMGGWYAKFAVFRALVAPQTFWGSLLAVVVAVNSVIAFYYYAQVLRRMWFDEPLPGRPQPGAGAGVARRRHGPHHGGHPGLRHRSRHRHPLHRRAAGGRCGTLFVRRAAYRGFASQAELANRGARAACGRRSGCCGDRPSRTAAGRRGCRSHPLRASPLASGPGSFAGLAMPVTESEGFAGSWLGRRIAADGRPWRYDEVVDALLYDPGHGFYGAGRGGAGRRGTS